MPRKQPAAPARNAGARLRLGLGAVASLALVGLACALVGLACALVGLACRNGDTARPDGATDGPTPDASNPLTLDIGVTGCGHFDVAGTCGAGASVGPCCTGTPPLSLAFAPIGSPDLNQFLWDFGDRTAQSSERAPSHVYAQAGTYEVALIGKGPMTGTVQPPHPLTVVVDAIAAGGSCDVDAQCAAGLTCVCAPGSGCPPAFARGVCSMACDAVPCAAGAVCASVPVLNTADAGAGAGTPWCIAPCATTSACDPGSVCQTLPTGPSTAAAPWTRGCLPLGVLADVGAPCRDASDALDDQACTTGRCADLGALGVCSASCDDSHPCPDQAACVLLSASGQLCLLTCTSGDDCGRDPLLTCAPAPRAGAGGGNVMVCSPKSCSSDTDCAPSGRCGPNGICVRIPM